MARLLHYKGGELIYEFKEGEDWGHWDGYLIVVHKDRMPKILYDDGTIEEVVLDGKNH